MTEFMSHIYDYILEKGMMAHIDKEAYKEARQKSEKLSTALYTIMRRRKQTEWRRKRSSPRPSPSGRNSVNYRPKNRRFS